MAEAFGVNLDIFIMPAHITVSVWNTDRTCAEMAQRKTASCGISFDLNTRLSQLSWEVADNSLSLPAAKENFKDDKADGEMGGTDTDELCQRRFLPTFRRRPVCHADSARLNIGWV